MEDEPSPEEQEHFDHCYSEWLSEKEDNTWIGSAPVTGVSE